MLLEVEAKVRELEEREKNLKAKLLATKKELERQKSREKAEEEEEEEEKEEEVKRDSKGFWATLCRIGKSIFGSIFGFFGIKI